MKYMSCKDCPDRYPGCHPKCEKYLAFRAERDRIREKEFQETELRKTFSMLRANGVEKARRSKGIKGFQVR